MILRARRRERKLLEMNTLLRFEISRLRVALAQISATPHAKEDPCGACIAGATLAAKEKIR